MKSKIHKSVYYDCNRAIRKYCSAFLNFYKKYYNLEEIQVFFQGDESVLGNYRSSFYDV